MALRKLLTAQEVAEIMGKPVHAIWRGAREGAFPFTVKISTSSYRFDPDALEDFIRTGGQRMPSIHRQEAVAA